MSVEIRNFRMWDAGRIATTKPIAMNRDDYHYNGIENLGRTMVEDDQPIAAWGMQPHWEGVASVWSEFSARALTRYPVLLAKSVRKHLEDHIERLNLHRVQVMVPDKDEVTIHWIEWLGFHQEGRFEQYMKGIDVLFYARLINR